MDNTREIIANNIVKYRKQCGLTQNDLAEKLNYSDKAVSKWERGDSLPDIIVLKEMAHLFGISLDALTSNIEVKPKLTIKSFFNKIYTSKFLISASATLLVWLVATIAFVCLSLFTQIPNLWMAFIYAIPVNFIVLISLTKFWKSNWYNFICVTLLILSIALSFYLTFNYDKIWLLFLICVPLILLAFLWFIARKKIFKRSNKK